MALSRYYMSPEERDLYEQDRFLQTIASVGQKDPLYALGLALGRGAGTAYGNMADQREQERMANDLAAASMVNEQGGFTPITEAQARERADNLSVSGGNFDKSWAKYQNAIKEKAKEYYVPRINSLVENGALQSNAGIAQLSNELVQLGQYDPDTVKGMTSGIAALAKAVGTPKGTIRTMSAAAANNANAGSTAGGKTAAIKQQTYADILKQADAINKTRATYQARLDNNADDTDAKSMLETLDAADADLRGQLQALVPQKEVTFSYKPQYQALAEALSKSEKASEGAPTKEQNMWDKISGDLNTEPQETQKTEGSSGNEYVFNVDNDIKTLNSYAHQDGTPLTVDEKKKLIENNRYWTAEQKAALLAKLR